MIHSNPSGGHYFLRLRSRNSNAHIQYMSNKQHQHTYIPNITNLARTSAFNQTRTHHIHKKFRNGVAITSATRVDCRHYVKFERHMLCDAIRYTCDTFQQKIEWCILVLCVRIISAWMVTNWKPIFFGWCPGEFLAFGSFSENEKCSCYSMSAGPHMTTEHPTHKCTVIPNFRSLQHNSSIRNGRISNRKPRDSCRTGSLP